MRSASAMLGRVVMFSRAALGYGGMGIEAHDFGRRLCSGGDASNDDYF
jgi:hypothetical protein